MRIHAGASDRFVPTPRLSKDAGAQAPKDVFLRNALDQHWSLATHWETLAEGGRREVVRNLGSLTWNWLKKTLPEPEEDPAEALRFLLAFFKRSSPESFDHSNRVADLARGLAEESQLNPEDMRALEHGLEMREVGLAAVELMAMDPERRNQLSRDLEGCEVLVTRSGALHDLGKLTVPDSILHKPGPLTALEREWVQLHPLIGEDLLRPLPGMRAVLPAVRGHHERWDGKGYPDGLAGEEIPLTARILCLADCYDAMTGERSYRRPLSSAEALMEILANAGTQFDPELAALFVSRLARTSEAA